mgnify:CR=1 FL=1
MTKNLELHQAKMTEQLQSSQIFQDALPDLEGLSKEEKMRRVKALMPAIEAELGEKLGTIIVDTTTATLDFNGQPGYAIEIAEAAAARVDLESFNFHSHGISKRRFRSPVETSEVTISGETGEVQKFIALARVGSEASKMSFRA